MSNNPVLQLAALNSGDGDVFGWVQGWRFALCDYLTFELGEHVPEFRPSPLGPDEDAFEYEELLHLRPTRNEAYHALHVLDRYRIWVGLAGRDY